MCGLAATHRRAGGALLPSPASRWCAISHPTDNLNQMRVCRPHQPVQAASVRPSAVRSKAAEAQTAVPACTGRPHDRAAVCPGAARPSAWRWRRRAAALPPPPAALPPESLDRLREEYLQLDPGARQELEQLDAAELEGRLAAGRLQFGERLFTPCRRLSSSCPAAMPAHLKPTLSCPPMQALRGCGASWAQASIG